MVNWGPLNLEQIFIYINSFYFLAMNLIEIRHQIPHGRTPHVIVWRAPPSPQSYDVIDAQPT